MAQSAKPKITILGCGTSTGVPIIGCTCAVCRSRNPKNQRLRASVFVQWKGKNLLVDTSTDLRQQALRAKIGSVDAVLYTHPHADHIHGIDELRCYNFIQKSDIPLYCHDWTARELRQKFDYIFTPGPVEGGGIPQLRIQEFSSSVPSMDVCGVPVIPVSLRHGSKECIGYRFGDAAYITDCSVIPEEALSRLEGLRVLILDCVRIASHRTHLNWDAAQATITRLKPKRTVLTHMGHDFEYVKWNKKLPRGVELAYDGMTV